MFVLKPTRIPENRLLEFLLKERIEKMKGCKKAIYVLVHCPPVGSDPRMEWDVVPWLGHPAMAPHALGRQKVSTAAGDVELRVPPIVERNYEILGWAYHRVEQLHPKPGDDPALELLTDQELLAKTVKLSLEYITLAEERRGHNARSRYLARSLREINQHLAQRQANRD
jgi:hypothetical protein